MKFCGYLLRDINFEPSAIQPCCDIHNLGVPQFPFRGGELDVAAYRRHVTDIFWRLQNDTSICAGCAHLVDADISFAGETAKDVGRTMRIHTVSLNQHRYRCNCRCVYCSLWKAEDKEPPYPVLPALKSLAASGVLHERCFFSWGGGEPSILGEFDEACAWLREKGYFQYVHTSALRFSEAVAAMLAAGAGGINISLDAGTPATYAAVKGLDGWGRAMDVLRRYVEASVSPGQIDLKYIVFEANNRIAEIEAFLLRCAELALPEVQFSLDFREVNTNAVSQRTLRAAAFLQTRAVELGITAKPFFIGAPLLAEIGRQTKAISL